MNIVSLEEEEPSSTTLLYASTISPEGRTLNSSSLFLSIEILLTFSPFSSKIASLSWLLAQLLHRNRNILQQTVRTKRAELDLKNKRMKKERHARREEETKGKGEITDTPCAMQFWSYYSVISSVCKLCKCKQ